MMIKPLTVLLSSVVAMLLIFTSCGEQKEVQVESLSGYDKIDLIIEEGLQESMFAGAVVVAGNAGQIVHRKAYGYADLYDENLFVVESPDSMTAAHLFDLASLTKIFATTYALMALHSDGEIEPDQRVASILPEFDTEIHSDITIRHLLNHSSGLMQWYPTYYVAMNRDERRAWLARQPLQGAPGNQRRYSDLGFMLLADIVESVSGMNFEHYLKERIYDRIGLDVTRFGPIEDGRVVSTSHGNPFEKKMVHDAEFGYSIDIDPDSWNGWRNYTLRGEVNDGNAHYTHQGVAGHAGLFSTADELAVLLQLVLNEGRYQGLQIFEKETLELFLSKDEHNNGLGWAMDPAVMHADTLTPGSAGHTGFTGTNVVVSPEADLFYILLTNRQHVGVDEDGNYPNLRHIRIRIASELFQVLN
jgi:serine-type D-Ala-D-Ala carboxypeptidase